MVFRGQRKDPQHLIKAVKYELGEFHLALSEVANVRGNLQQISSTPRNQIWWRPPAGEVTKINWDAVVSSMQQSMKIGIVVRDDTGKVWACICSSRPFYSSPIISEC